MSLLATMALLFCAPALAASAPVTPAPPSPPPPAAARFQAVFFNIGEPAPFWDVFSKVALAAAARLDIDLEVLNAGGDHLRMIEQAREVAARRVKPAYALINNEKGAAGRMLEALAGAGIPTLLIMSVFDEADQRRYGRPREKLPAFLGTLRPDNTAAGSAVAQALLEAARGRFPTPVRMLAISGAKATQAASDRDQGLRKAVAASPGVVLQQLVHSAWRRDKAHRQLAGLLRRWPETKLIWAANDPMALGALDALRERGQEPGRDVLVASINLSTEALQLVQAGQLVASVGGHFLGGAWALVLLRDHFDGLDFAGEGLEQQFPMGVIDRAGVGEYLAELGDQRWERIDFARFSRSRNRALTRHEFTLGGVLEQLRAKAHP